MEIEKSLDHTTDLGWKKLSTQDNKRDVINKHREEGAAIGDGVSVKPGG